VFANIVAINRFGSSIPSSDGNGAVVVIVPTAPLNLINYPEITSASQIYFTWSNGAFDGGKPIIDYRVTYD
jgi:hypothetical protein